MLACPAMLCEDQVMQSRDPRYWEDYKVGTKYPLGSTGFTAEEIVEFAEKFDPQTFHVDAEAAKESLFGGLCASGWHVAAKLMRLFVDNYVDKRTALGSPGLDELRWLKPVRPGDTLYGKASVEEKRESASKPDRGIVKLKYWVENQRGEMVMSFYGNQLVSKRPG